MPSSGLHLPNLHMCASQGLAFSWRGHPGMTLYWVAVDEKSTSRWLIHIFFRHPALKILQWITWACYNHAHNSVESLPLPTDKAGRIAYMPLLKCTIFVVFRKSTNVHWTGDIHGALRTLVDDCTWSASIDSHREVFTFNQHLQSVELTIAARWNLINPTVELALQISAPHSVN